MHQSKIVSVCSISHVICFVIFVQEGLKVSAPLLIGRLLSYFQPDPAISRTDAYITAALLSLCTFSEGALHAPNFFINQRCGLHLRLAAGSLIYRKVSKLSAIDKKL